MLISHLILDLLLAVDLLVSIIHVVDANLVVLTPQITDTVLDDFHAILHLSYCVDVNGARVRLLVCHMCNRKRKIINWRCK